jgi:hypothetical protein
VSTDTGATFTAITDLPAVAVHDVVVQEQEKDLIVGTHGRSLYRADVGLLQQIAGQSSPTLTIASLASQRYSSRYGSASWYRDNTAPELTFQVYSPGADAGATLSVKTASGLVLKTMDIPLRKGINTLTYDLSFAADKAGEVEEALNKDRKEETKPIKVNAADDGRYYLRAGKYSVSIQAGDETAETELEVK